MTVAHTYMVLFVVSLAFPIVASLIPADAVSRAMGFLDVAVALALLGTGIYVVPAKAPASPEHDRRAVAWYKVTGAVPLALLVVFFVAGSHVRWEVLLVGLAWRAWLLWYSLPATLALLSSGEPTRPH